VTSTERAGLADGDDAAYPGTAHPRAARYGSAYPGAAGNGTAQNSAPRSGRGRHAAEPTVGQLVSEVSTHLSTIIQGEIQLAKLELRDSVKNAGVGAGAFISAAILLVFSLTFAFIGIAELFARYLMPRWAAFLVVFALLVLAAVLLVVTGLKKIKKVKGPARTIATGKDTVAYLKTNARRSS
jgi:uncharacterized membrane protein YqjE